MTTLRTVLRLNAASCIGFGLLFLAMPSQLALFLSSQTPAPSLVLQLIGIVLLANGLHLIWTSIQPDPKKALILYFSLGDFLWVAGTLILLIAGLWVTSIAGIAAAIVVALAVGCLGVMQMKSLKS